MLADQLGAPLESISRAAVDILDQKGDAQDRAKRILNQANHLQSISQKLLDIATVKEKALMITQVNVSNLLIDTASNLERYAESMGISIEVKDDPMILGADEELLSTLIYDLTENVIKACRSGSCVELFCADKIVRIESNEGFMRADQIELFTKVFGNNETESRISYCATLGLTLCKHIADMLGVAINFEFEQGYGARVTIDFNTEE
jgi:K+-sensing histidine kinase KdpD